MAALSLWARARRSRPAGDLLSFAGTNERRQSKVPERQRSDRIAWPESSVDDESFGSIVGSANAEDLQRDESASIRRVRTLRHQPNFPAEALGSDRWRSGICFGYFHLCQQMKVTRRPGETGGLSAGAQNNV
jgi:hypothetical protein